MKITPKHIKKHQMGGQMEMAAPEEEPVEQGGAQVEEGAPAQEGDQDPIMMLAQMSAQALQSQDCQMAMQVCQAFMEIVQQMQGGATEKPQGEPVFARNGAKLQMVKRIRK